jgi:hypothetical protein
VHHGKNRPPMSPLGQKRTFRREEPMSALSLKADIDRDLIRFSVRDTLALQWRIDDREALLVLLEVDVGDAEHFAQLIVRHLHRAG